VSSGIQASLNSALKTHTHTHTQLFSYC